MEGIVKDDKYTKYKREDEAKNRHSLHVIYLQKGVLRNFCARYSRGG
ncbi:hypothetical protein ACEQPO_03910 [Bacillus sp. SL00103]